MVNELLVLGEIQVVTINRKNKTFIPTNGALFEEGDLLYILVITSATDKLKSMLDLV
jgi:trk system potassium uptake protein TrkA